MLYGNKTMLEKIQKEIRICEEEQGIKVIYGANIGSISKGLQYKDSDYDTRFLYVKKDFPQKIWMPGKIAEKEIIYRKYFDEEIFECIPFWEFSSFMQFLINPYIDHFSTGIYNVVGWTFLSPYNYDPYGIQMKLLPLIQKMFHKDYCIAYHKSLLEKFCLKGDMLIAIDYMQAMHAALSINWMLEYNEYPPVYIRTLLANEPKIYDEVCEIINRFQNEAARYVDKSDSKKPHGAHFKIMTKHFAVMDEYLEMTKRKLELFKEKEISEKEKAEYAAIIGKIYGIVEASLDSENKINGIN